MERKTIGSLISALRRAAGMTQRDLAEKLNVSDKAVSRWERDESAPDLTLLPLIADLFDITVDELLRGKRKNSNESAENTEQIEYKKEENSHRQKMLLANSMRKFKSFMFIPIGLEVAGLLVAMICNFGFYRAALGFLFGITFMVAAFICSFVFTGMALPTDEDEYDSLLIKEYKRSVLTYTYQVLFAAFIVMIPIVLIGWIWFISGNSYVGWKLDTFLFLTPILILIVGGIAYEIGKFAIFPRMLKKYGVMEEENEKDRRKKIGKLSKNCVIALLCSLIIPAVLLFGMVETVDKRRAFTRGKSFESFEEFKEYAETYKPNTYYNGSEVIVMEEIITIDIITGEKVPVSESPESYDGVLHTVPTINENGEKNNYEVLYSYYLKNGEIVETEWSVDSDDRLPVTVYTVYHIAQSESVHTAICVSLILFMCAEFITIFVIYLKKRSKIIKNV